MMNPGCASGSYFSHIKMREDLDSIFADVNAMAAQLSEQVRRPFITALPSARGFGARLAEDLDGDA